MVKVLAKEFAAPVVGRSPQWFCVYKLVLVTLFICTLELSELQTFSDLLSKVLRKSDPLKLMLNELC